MASPKSRLHMGAIFVCAALLLSLIACISLALQIADHPNDPLHGPPLPTSTTHE